MPLGPSIRDLRDRIAVQRRAVIANALGGTQGAWGTLIASRSAKLAPYATNRGNYEHVEAARLQGIALFECWIRFDSQTAQILTSDRVCDARTLQADGVTYLRTFNVRYCEDPDRRNIWLKLALELGVADG